MKMYLSTLDDSAGMKNLLEEENIRSSYLCDFEAKRTAVVF